jgi:hypothetical protein
MPDLQQIAQIILDLHIAGADNDWTSDDLLEILRRDDPRLYRETLWRMQTAPTLALGEVA